MFDTTAEIKEVVMKIGLAAVLKLLCGIDDLVWFVFAFISMR